MKTRRIIKRRSNKQGGYALVLVVFLTALALVATMSIGLRIYTEGRREKEKEMIWRGNQYVRGVKLYYRKFGRFPTSMDDLVKPKMGNIRFMRQAYKDPMNKEDGSWRLIYVGPAGQLIGSLKPRQSSIQMPTAPGQPGTPQPGATTGQTPPGTPPSTTPSGTSATGAGTGAQGTNAAGTDSNGPPVPTGDTPTIIGGNIIGVGSKVNQSSVIVYDKATNYRLFEFIWDPSKDLAIVGQQGTQVGTPGGPGQNPTGPQTNPMNPQPNPQPPTPNPNPNPQ